MKVGFTGTQEGMTEAQFWIFRLIMSNIWADEFHHGGCIGADADAHDRVKGTVKVVLHPPINTYKQAIFEADEIRDPLDYMDRNQAIVDESDFLLAAPKEHNEEQRSGTWATVRRARKKGIPVIILEP